MSMGFDINFVNWLFCGFDLDFLRECLSLVTLIVVDYIYVFYSFIAISILSLIILESRKADKIIKQIAPVGTGVLAGVGALDSSLNLYDRFKASQENKGSDSGESGGSGGSGGSDSGGDSNDSDKNKGDGDNNKQSQENKCDIKSNNNNNNNDVK